MKKIFGKRNFFLISSMVISLVTSATLTYSWFGWIKNLGNNIINPGKMESGLEIERWTDGAWASANPADTYYLGEINNITELPANSHVFIKFKVNDPNDYEYLYNVIIYFIDLTITDDTSTYVLPNVNYYTGNPNRDPSEDILIAAIQNSYDFTYAINRAVVYNSTAGKNINTIYITINVLAPGSVTGNTDAILQAIMANYNFNFAEWSTYDTDTNSYIYSDQVVMSINGETVNWLIHG